MSNASIELVMDSMNVMEELSEVTNLSMAQEEKDYIIKDVNTGDDDLREFLFSLGCFKGEVVTLISSNGSNYVINIKDARYSIDRDLAEAIYV